MAAISNTDGGKEKFPGGRWGMLQTTNTFGIPVHVTIIAVAGRVN